MAKDDAKDSSKRRTASAAQRASRVRRVGKLLLAFAVVVMAVDALVGDRGMMAMLRARKQYEELSHALERQKVENAKLREEASRLKDDPSAIEELARRNLGLIRPGEKVFIVKDLASPVRH